VRAEERRTAEFMAELAIRLTKFLIAPLGPPRGMLAMKRGVKSMPILDTFSGDRKESRRVVVSLRN